MNRTTLTSTFQSLLYFITSNQNFKRLNSSNKALVHARCDEEEYNRFVAKVDRDPTRNMGIAKFEELVYFFSPYDEDNSRNPSAHSIYT